MVGQDVLQGDDALVNRGQLDVVVVQLRERLQGEDRRPDVIQV
jgi:hypothetical protein